MSEPLPPCPCCGDAGHFAEGIVCCLSGCLTAFPEDWRRLARAVALLGACERLSNLDGLLIEVMADNAGGWVGLTNAEERVQAASLIDVLITLGQE